MRTTLGVGMLLAATALAACSHHGPSADAAGGDLRAEVERLRAENDDLRRRNEELSKKVEEQRIALAEATRPVVSASAKPAR